MKIVTMKLAELKPDPCNLRRHGAENIAMIKKSLTEYGQYKPLIVDAETHTVKIGNGRLEAMRELGWTECRCIEIDFAGHPGMEVLDNRLNELSSWDDPEIDAWLLNDRGVDWWGVDLKKSAELLKAEKRSPHPQRTAPRPGAPPPPSCPCCGKPLKKMRDVLL